MGAIFAFLRPLLLRILLKRVADYTAGYLNDRKRSHTPDEPQEAIGEPQMEGLAVTTQSKAVSDSLEEPLEDDAEPDDSKVKSLSTDKWLLLGALAALGLAIGTGISYYVDQKR